MDIENKEVQLAVPALARENLLAFCIAMNEKFMLNWHLEIIAKKLEAAAREGGKRIMVFMPPRHGKSELCSRLFPAWFIGRFPHKKIITASYSHTLSSGFGRDVRDNIQHEAYKNIFGNVELAEDSQAKDRFHTKQKGGYLATGRGTITGFGADLLLIDDPIADDAEVKSSVMMENLWQWYTKAASTRMEPNGSIVLINTRWGDNDLAGMILEKEGTIEQGGEWEVISFPAIAEEDEPHRQKGTALWPERYPLTELLKVKKKDIETFSCLYQQNPINDETQEFKKSWFKQVQPWQLPQNLRYITSVDLAISKATTADNTVVMTVGVSTDNHKFVVKTTSGKLDPHQTIDAIFDHHTQFQSSVIAIESVGYQAALEHFIKQEMFRRNQFMNLEPVKTRSNKIERIKSLITQYKNGSVWHVPGEAQDLELELLRFPKAKHDDHADALSIGKDFWQPNRLTQWFKNTKAKTIKQLKQEEGLLS